MFLNSWDLEVHAQYIRQQIEARAADRALVATAGRATTPWLPLASVRRGLGRGLIAVGERLAGPTTPQAAAPCTVTAA